MPSRRALAVWVVLGVMSIPLQAMLDRRLSTLGSVHGSESATVQQRVREEFASPFDTPALLVITGLRASVETDSIRADVRALIAPIVAHPAVTGVISPASSLDTLLLSIPSGGGAVTALAIVGVRSAYVGAIDSLRATSRATIAARRSTHPSLTMRWTGERAVVDDLRRETAREAAQAEGRALPVTLLIAIWAFGSLSAALLAVLAAALAITVSLGGIGALSLVGEPSLFVRTVVPFIGLALTVDYSLYIRMSAAAGAERGTVLRTIRIAAVVVAIGFCGLIIAPTGELRWAAAGGTVAAVVAASAALTLTPWRAASGAADVLPKRWHAWGWFVMRHPVAVIVTCALPLLFLARQAIEATYVTPLEGWLPAGVESADALVDLTRAGRDGSVAALRVLVDLPGDAPVLSTDGWAILTRAGSALRRLPGVADVHSLATIGTGSLLVARSILPDAVRGEYVSRNGRAALIDIVPAGRGGADALALVERIRAIDAASVLGVAGGRISVAGLPAYALDYEVAIRRALPWIVAGTALATFVALTVAMRAPVVAAKTVLLNVVIATAAVGATVVVFESPAITHLFGRVPLSTIFPTVPALAFAATFGMSMDYELFLLGGIIEARRDARAGARQPGDASSRAERTDGTDESDAIVRGLALAGPVIVRSAAIMGGVFLAFATCALPSLAMVGFALAVAVALDATLGRMALAPAMLRIAGRWNWWPAHE